MKYVIGLVLLFGVMCLSQTALSQVGVVSPLGYVETPLHVGYVRKEKDGRETLEVFPHLDILRKEEVCGIAIGRFVFALKNLPDMNWYDAMESAQEIRIAGKQAFLPRGRSGDYNVSQSQMEDFNATAELLREHGIRVDDLKDCAYWTSNEANDGHANRFFTGCGGTPNGPKDIPHSVRVVVSY